jgi:dipeptidase E
MKLLLTSGGLANRSIEKALFDLVGKKSEETSLAFVPTASNEDVGDKEFLIDDLIGLKKLNFKSIDIADISAVEEKIWREKLEAADILFFEGGDTYYLMRWINKSGLARILPDLLKTKVYVGVSAGSVVLSKDLMLTASQKLYEEDLDETESLPGLNCVDFYVLPHLSSPYFENVREDLIRKATANMSGKIYAIDDESAVKVYGDKVEVVSEGKWFEIN